MKNLFLALFLALAPAAFASIWYVDGVHGSDSNDCKTRHTTCKTIGHAISLASSGDSIFVGPATYMENLTVSISLSIIGADARTTIVDGNQSGTVFIVSQAYVLLSRLTIQNGRQSPGSDSGGIYNDGGVLTVSMCTIRGNSGGYGGAIVNALGPVTVKRSTITGNTGGYAGAIADFDTATVINSTIAGNSGGYAGAIVNFSTATISSSTIAGNSGGYVGGIENYGGPVTLQNTILADSPGNCQGTVFWSEGYNLSDDNSCNFNGPGDMNNTEPLLGTLGNNGGPTQTIPELPGSPTIDAGNPTGCTNNNGPMTIDQRGYPRPGKNKQDQRCDIGAYESQTD